MPGGFCPDCGQPVLLLSYDGTRVHKNTRQFECSPREEHPENVVHDLEYQALQAVLDLVKWFRVHEEPLMPMPRVYVSVLDRGDALLDAYDPHWRATSRR